jgi:FkbM family methyltransferase
MKHPDVWPAVHGWGGANELDTLKLVDALGCKGKNCSKEPLFDLMMDLGANFGYYTEKLTVRNFAKHYIMIEANPDIKKVLDERWGNKTWKKTWFTEQFPADPAPTFQIINKALSNHSEGKLDMCQTEPSFEGSDSCNVSISSVDKLVPGALNKDFQEHFRQAKSAFIKIDTEGMDELVLRGMKQLLNETRGKNEDGSPRFLVNFFQFEWSPHLSHKAKKREHFKEYDIKTVTTYLEKIGFETFLIGPRYLPLSHGSYDDEFKKFAEDPNNNAGVRENFPNFDDRLCKECNTHDHATFTGDIFAIRASHPRLTELKLALGACQESKDFDMKDLQYEFNSMPQGK